MPDWAAAVDGLPTPDWMTAGEQPAGDEAPEAAWAEARELAPSPEPVRLAPHTPDQPMPLPSGEMDEDDVFQWLEGLAARSSVDEETAAAEPAHEALGPAAGVIPEEPEAGLDWLERLAAERGIDAEIEPQTASAAAAQVETPDWMRSEAEPPTHVGAEEPEHVPVWLQDAAKYEAERDTTPLSVEDAARLEQLAAAQAMADAGEAAALPSDEVETAPTIEALKPEPSAEAEASADWLTGIDEGLTEETGAVDLAPPVTDEVPLPPRRPATSELEIPVWLRAAAEAAPPEPPAPSVEPEPEPTSAPAAPEPAVATASIDETPSAELRAPDWLRLAAETETARRPAREAGPPPEPAPIEAPEHKLEAGPPAPEPETAAPDWLADAAQAESAPAAVEARPAPEPVVPAPEEPARVAAAEQPILPAAEQPDVPDWLQAAAEAERPPSRAPEPARAEVSAAETAPPPATPAEEAPAAPEWLEAAAEAEVEGPAFEAPAADAAAAPAPQVEPEPALPAWLPTPAPAAAEFTPATPAPAAHPTVEPAPAPPAPALTRAPAGWPTRGPAAQPPAPPGWPRFQPTTGADRAGWGFPADAGRGTLESELEASVPEWLRPPLESAPPPAPPAPEAVQPSGWVPEVAAPLPEARPARRAGGRPKGTGASPGEVLNRARRELASGDLDAAMRAYGQLIRRRNEVEAVIEDLQAALGRSGAQPAIWQALGDAYMRSERLPEAIEAYRRGLEAI